MIDLTMRAACKGRLCLCVFTAAQNGGRTYFINLTSAFTLSLWLSAITLPRHTYELRLIDIVFPRSHGRTGVILTFQRTPHPESLCYARRCHRRSIKVGRRLPPPFRIANIPIAASFSTCRQMS